MNNIMKLNYKREVFNTCMLECFGRIEEACCEPDDSTTAAMAKRMSDAFYTDLLKLDSSTIAQTKARLSEAVTFIQDMINISEAIATDKADIADKEDLQIEKDQKVELSPEDEELVDKLFEEKNPKLQVDQVRDATVKSLLAEDKKAQEIRDSYNIAKSKVAANNGDERSLEETVSRLENVGPTSLMNAIIHSVSAAAISDVNESTKTPVSVGKIMSENAQEIKDRACMMYMLYEAANTFGVTKYTPREVKALAESIYYNK